MKKASWKGLLALASLSVVMLLVLAACGSDDPTPTTAAADPTATPEPAKELITFTDLNWNSGHIQTAIASYIVNKGYGYPVDAVTLDTLPGFNALEKGDTQVSMEIWLPNQQEAWARSLSRVTPRTRTLASRPSKT
jgi:ABC-type proline/glycine betaine transport system substrate-binding protein